MDMHFYVVRNRKSLDRPVAIGKVTSEMKFIYWYVYKVNDRWRYPPLRLNSRKEVLDYLKKSTSDSNNYVIVDDFDQIISYDDFIEMIGEKQKDDAAVKDNSCQNVIVKACNNCKYKMKLVEYDYSHGGCVHTDCEGYACLAFADEGLVTQMVGCDPENGICEMFIPKGGCK